MLKHIPNLLTLTNLFLGCCTIAAVLGGRAELAIWLIPMALLFDFLDGWAARLLHATAPLGKELDSLADLVSFGVAPGMILYFLLNPEDQTLQWIHIPVFLLPVFAALRLAKFNLDLRQDQEFLGLPTPSVALFVVGLLPIYAEDSWGLQLFLTQPVVLYGITILLSILMIVELPMFSLKLKNLSWKDNKSQYLFLLFALILLMVFREAAFTPIITGYILFSVGIAIFRTN